MSAVGLLESEPSGLAELLAERGEAVLRVLPAEVASATVDAWVVHVPGMDPEALQRVREGEVPALFLVPPGEARAWHRVLRKGLHDVAWLPWEAEEVRSRLLGLVARRHGWNEVSSTLAREVAHDLRGPLQALQLTVTALEGDGAIAEGFREDVDALLEAVDLADLMLNGIGNLGRRAILLTDAPPIDVMVAVRKAASRKVFNGRVSVVGGEALPVRVPADALAAAVEDVVRVAWIRGAGKRDVAVQCMRLGGEAVLTVRARAYDALLEQVQGLLVREKTVMLRRARVPMPLAGLAYARDVALGAGGELTVQREGQELQIEVRLPLA